MLQNMRKNRQKWYVLAVAALCAAELLTVLASWLAAALSPSSDVRSLLSGEGLRWLLGSYRANVDGAALFYILAVCFAAGAMIESGVSKKIFRLKKCTSDERLAVGMFIAGVLFAAILSALFALWPHSFLLSVNGTLTTGPYPKAVLAMFVAAVACGSCVFAAMSASRGAWRAVYRTLTAGLKAAMPFALLWFLAAGVVRSIVYCFA